MVWSVWIGGAALRRLSASGRDRRCSRTACPPSGLRRHTSSITLLNLKWVSQAGKFPFACRHVDRCRSLFRCSAGDSAAEGRSANGPFLSTGGVVIFGVYVLGYLLFRTSDRRRAGTSGTRTRPGPDSRLRRSGSASSGSALRLRYRRSGCHPDRVHARGSLPHACMVAFPEKPPGRECVRISDREVGA